MCQDALNITILIVDDDEFQLDVITHLVLTCNKLAEENYLEETYHYDYMTAADGTEAIRLAQNHGNIDLALLDVKLPDMMGFELLVRLKAVLGEKVAFCDAVRLGRCGDGEQVHVGGSCFLYRQANGSASNEEPVAV